MIVNEKYRKGLVGILFLLPFLVFSQNSKQKNKQKGAEVTIQFHHFVGNDHLVLDDSTYYNTLNQAFTISKLNYYIGQIRLFKKDGSSVFIDDYYLISEDEEKVDSKIISLKNIPSGEYSSLQFIVGVDSLRNCSGTQSGALDPLHAMFWTWNTGYIFFKLEGNSPQSTEVANMLEYHIGGYKEPTNCIRTISLPLSIPLVLEKENQAIIHVKTDVMELLKNPETIDFSKIPTVNTLHNASMMADNYSDMFSIVSN